MSPDLHFVTFSELENGEIFVWCVSTAQLERRFARDNAVMLSIDRQFYGGTKRHVLPHLTKEEQEVYDLGGNTALSAFCDILILDIRSLGEVTAEMTGGGGGIGAGDGNESADDRHNVMSNALKSRTNGRRGRFGNTRRDHDIVASPETTKLSDLLSLLLDWGIGAEFEWLYLQEFRVLMRDIWPCYGYCGDFESLTLLFPVCFL